MHDTSTFPPTLRRYRERVELSQSKLAELAELDHSYVSRLESGTRTPSRKVVEAIAEVLALRPYEQDELLAAAGYRGNQEIFYDFTVQRLAYFLGQPDVPYAVADQLRRVIADLIALCETLLSDMTVAEYQASMKGPPHDATTGALPGMV
jgi:transcriptional regulator with XRE-family HTH domain